MANAARQAAPVIAQNGSYRKISGNWPRAITQADPNMQACDAPTLFHICAHAVGFPIRRLDFPSVIYSTECASAGNAAAIVFSWRTRVLRAACLIKAGGVRRHPAPRKAHHARVPQRHCPQCAHKTSRAGAQHRLSVQQRDAPQALQARVHKAAGKAQRLPLRVV